MRTALLTVYLLQPAAAGRPADGGVGGAPTAALLGAAPAPAARRWRIRSCAPAPTRARAQGARGAAVPAAGHAGEGGGGGRAAADLRAARAVDDAERKIGRLKARMAAPAAVAPAGTAWRRGRPRCSRRWAPPGRVALQVAARRTDLLAMLREDTTSLLRMGTNWSLTSSYLTRAEALLPHAPAIYARGAARAPRRADTAHSRRALRLPRASRTPRNLRQFGAQFGAIL